MTYDPTRSRTILFGGFANALLNDTWEWNGEFWTQIADIGPPARQDHALCFDGARNATILFGGTSAAGPLGDTWSWNGEDWTQLEDSGPSARAGHAMIFDPARGRAVLFGGQSAAGLQNDTWEWDGDAWTQQEDIGPSARKYHVLGFDPVRNRVVLFGGDPGNGNALGDTWSWDGANWTQVSDFGANPCLRAAMVATDVQISMFGGLDSAKAAPAPTVFHETWVFDGKHWTHRQDIGPGPRFAHAMAFDSTRRSIVLFGGLPVFTAAGDAALRDHLLGDTWEHLETDAPPPPPPAPPGPAAGPNVAAVELDPLSALPGIPVTVNVTLDGAGPVATVVDVVWMLQSVFEDTPGHDFPPGSEHVIGQILITAGATTGGTTFPAPASAEPVVILAGVENGGSFAFATLNILSP